ncbi:hypothetical protein TNCV_1649011 [Trichonephila clavipes]|nr:hypothetical protein TNCV_1649011 [Trichonephila clavipes]
MIKQEDKENSGYRTPNFHNKPLCYHFNLYLLMRIECGWVESQYGIGTPNKSMERCTRKDFRGEHKSVLFVKNGRSRDDDEIQEAPSSNL